MVLKYRYGGGRGGGLKYIIYYIFTSQKYMPYCINYDRAWVRYLNIKRISS